MFRHPWVLLYAERDQVQGFYDITHDEVTKTEAHVKNIEHQMERMQAAHREDIRVRCFGFCDCSVHHLCCVLVLSCTCKK